MHNTQEETDLQKTKVNATKIRKVCADANNFYIGKEWRLHVQYFRGRMVVVVRQVDENLSVSKIFKIQQLQI